MNIKEVIKYHIINGAQIDTIAALQFINAHPLPEGYTDIEQLIGY